MRVAEFVSESTISSFASHVKDTLGLQEFFLYERGNVIYLDTIIVGKQSQKRGIGSKAIQMLTDYADKENKRIVLTPGIQDKTHGTTSRNRLVNFYKKFGFKESKGRHIDYEIGAGKMYRDPNISEYNVDNKSGLGATPNNQDVHYFGMRVLMKPSMFLKLAHPLSTPGASVEYITQHIKQGKGLGSPFLLVDIPYEWDYNDFRERAEVSGHEGRHRMLAIQKVEGDDPVEVHIFPRGGLRARDLTPEVVKHLNAGIISQSRNEIRGPIFKPM